MLRSTWVLVPLITLESIALLTYFDHTKDDVAHSWRQSLLAGIEDCIPIYGIGILLLLFAAYKIRKLDRELQQFAD
jgi:hypothetical protein